MTITAAYDVILRLGDLEEGMARMLLGSDLKACRAGIEIGAIDAFLKERVSESASRWAE